LKQELADARASIEAQSKKGTDLSAATEELRSKLEVKAREAKELAERQAQSAREVADLTARLEASRKELEKARQEAAEAAERLAEKNDENSTLKQELRQEIDDRESQGGEVRKELDLAKERHKKTLDYLGNLKELWSALQKELVRQPPDTQKLSAAMKAVTTAMRQDPAAS
jgi:chromosome segregation ATPase